MTPRFLERRMILRLRNPNSATMKKFMPRARANATSGRPISETMVLFSLESGATF